MKFVNLSPMQAWAFEQFTVLIKPCWLSGYGGDTFQWMWCCLLLDKYKVSNSGWVVCLMNCRASVMWRSILPVLPDFEKIFLSNHEKDGRLWWPDSKEGIEMSME